MNNRYLYLKSDNKSIFFKYIKDRNINKYYIFKEKNMIFRLFRKFDMLNTIIFGLWKFNIKKYEYIILSENGYSKNISKFIKTKNPNCKIIMYYWNPLNEQYKKILNDNYIDEFWTFDRYEAEIYNLKYNPQFYTKHIKLKECNIDNDVIFLGRAKGRKEEIISYEKQLNKNDITTKFIIIEQEKDIMSYDSYLNLLSKSKCILDYNQNGQIGLTLRPMESIFLQKKLITNNKDIVKYSFYNKNNIFIIGVDDNKRLAEFINSPFEEVEQNILNYYDYESWLNRFGIKK